MKPLRKALYAGAGLLSLAFIGSLAAPKIAAATRAALVEIVVPSTPFTGSVELSGYGVQSVGPGTGTLALTQIMITNYDSVVNQVNIGAFFTSGNNCGGASNATGATPAGFLILKVQPNSTLVVTSSSPMVYPPLGGLDNLPHTCIGATMPVTGGNVRVMYNGFVN